MEEIVLGKPRTEGHYIGTPITYALSLFEKVRIMWMRAYSPTREMRGGGCLQSDHAHGDGISSAPNVTGIRVGADDIASCSRAARWARWRNGKLEYFAVTRISNTRRNDGIISMDCRSAESSENIWSHMEPLRECAVNICRGCDLQRSSVLTCATGFLYSGKLLATLKSSLGMTAP